MTDSERAGEPGPERCDAAGPEHAGDAVPDVVSVGAATVDRTYEVTNLPEPDGGAFARSVSESFGGVGANVATGLGRLGRDVSLLARVGEDGMADRVLENLEAGPVDTELVRRRPGTTTHCIVPRDPAGERMILTAGDSTRRLRIREGDRPVLRSTQVVFVTAYAPDPVTRDLLDVAAAPGGPALVFDLSGRVEELTDRGTERSTVDRAVQAADLFVVGEVAATSYLDCPPDEAAAELRSRGCSRGAVTFGEAGATLFDGDETVDVPAFDVDVVDTTGAGDAFVAGLVDRWLLGDDDLATAGRFAAALGALNCRAEGARGGMPRTAVVSEFLGDRPD